MEKLPQENQILPENSAERENQPVFENLVYDINPALNLVRKNADVSYVYCGERFQRNRDTYRDQNNNLWIEINSSPRSQMVISLLSQPFFNISSVVEVSTTVGRISKFFSKLNPKVGKILESTTKTFGKKSSIFLSKVLDHNKIEQKDKEQMIADYVVFESIFETGGGDRNFSEEHNIKISDKSYALFDFESMIVPFKYFATSKSLKIKNKPEKDGMDNIFHKLKSMMWGNYKDDPKLIRAVVPLSLIKSIVKKLKELKTFYKKDDAIDFMSAVLEKSKYKDECISKFRANTKGDALIQSIHTKKIENVWLEKKDFTKPDESYFNPNELVLGLLAQIYHSSNILYKQLMEKKELYESEEEYLEVMTELEDVVFSDNELFISESDKIKNHIEEK